MSQRKFFVKIILNDSLIHFFQKMTEEYIKQLSSVSYAVRGYLYYKKKRTTAFYWQSADLLEVTVHGSIEYTVFIRWSDSKPFFSCSCPVGKACKHIICALYTIKDLCVTKNNELGFFDFEPKEILKAAPLKKLEYSIFIDLDKKEYEDKLYFQYGKTVITSRTIPQNCPEDLKKLISCSSYYWNKKKLLLDFFQYSTKEYSFYIQKEGQIFPASYDHDTQFNLKLEINKVEDTFVIDKVAVLKRKKSKNFLEIDEHFIFNKDTHKIYLIANHLEENRAAYYFSELKRIARIDSINEKPLQVTSNTKQSLIIDRTKNAHTILKIQQENDLEDFFIFKKNGLSTKIQKKNSSYSLVIKPHALAKNITVSLVSDICEAYSFSFLFEETIDVIAKKIKYKTHLRPQLIKKIIFNACIQIPLIEQEKDLKDLCLDASYEIGLESPHAISRYFNQMYADVQEGLGGNRLLEMSDNGFFIVTDNPSFPLKILALFHKIFKTGYIFSKKYDELIVEPQILYKNINLLQKNLADIGVQVLFNKKKIKFSKLDIKIETKSHSVDWLEIQPEITCDTSKLSKKEIDLLVYDNNGMIEREEYVEFFDENSSALLNSLITLMQKSPKNKDTAEKSDIVLMQRLSMFDLLELKNNGIKIILSEENEEIISSLENFKKIKEIAPPQQLKAELKPYQKEGYYWLSFLYTHKFGGCLADDMGLGKTVQTIAFLAAIHEGIIKSYNKTSPHLIVMPPSLIFNWQNEIAVFYPEFKVHTFAGPKRDMDFTDCDIVLTTYDVISIDFEKIKNITFNVLVFDEAQIVKNIFSQRTSFARKIKASFRLCLTGTPLENHIGEYYSIMDLALPGLLPDYKAFKAQTKDLLIDNYLIKSTKPFILRRTKEKLLDELPSKSEKDIYLDMSEFQKGLYLKTVAEVKDTIKNAFNQNVSHKAHIIALAAISKLRQICVSPELVMSKNSSESKNIISPKIDYLLEAVKELHAKKSASLVFSQFIKSLDIVERRLQESGIPYLRIDGSTPMAQRKNIVESFQNTEDYAVLLLSLKTGGVGLNLTRANHVFHVDPWWNPSVENQASDRSYRIGQKQDVLVTRLLMRSSIEEKIMVLKKQKAELFDAVMQGSQAKSTTLSKSDFDFILE